MLPAAQAANELIRRRLIRSDLTEWARYFGADRNWSPARHHLFLLDVLQKVTDNELKHPESGKACKNVIVLMPPGSAKSSYVSVIFPPWYLQRKPNSRILACSHSADLIESFSRECRNAVEAHGKILGYSLSADSRAVQEWSTTNGGTYRCSGVGAGISGRRAYIGYIDDYLGSREDADSKLIRDKQWHWYWNDFWPRLVPGAPQVIVANRQHEDDLVGRLIAAQPEKWVVIRIPFFAEESDPLGRKVGDPLWPEWFDTEKVEEIRQLRTLEPRTYAGLYQQKPAPEEGNFFKKDWLLGYTRDDLDALMKNDNVRVYGAGDWAVSEAKDANRTCFGGAVEAPNGDLYILPDIFWKVAGPKEVVQAFLSFLQRRKPMVTWSEKGHISKAWGPFLKDMMEEEKFYSYIEEVTPARAKDVRARSIQARMSLGKVRFPHFASWWPDAMHELLTFPGGKTDDFVDFLAHLGMGLNKITRATRPKVEESEDLLNKPWRPTMKAMKAASYALAQSKKPKYEGR